MDALRVGQSILGLFHTEFWPAVLGRAHTTAALVPGAAVAVCVPGTTDKHTELCGAPFQVGIDWGEFLCTSFVS